MSLLDRLAISTLPLVPRPIMRRLSARYIAGEHLADALAKLRELRDQGFQGIIDLLGEEIADEAEARAVVALYLEAARAVHAAGLPAYVSVKPTHVGLLIAPDLAHELYAELARALAKLGLFLRVEMEGHTTTTATLGVFARLRAEFDNVGIVLQSRLFRTPQDIAALPAARVNVRMVKGIYLEPEDIAHVAPDPIRDAFVACTRALWERGDFVALATHDAGLAERLFALADELDKGPADYELQVLLGVQEPLSRAWRDAGRPVRVYVPYGPQWRAYSQRRLRKNPQIFRHVLRDVLGIS
jgi:proline dehydrogenase